MSDAYQRICLLHYHEIGLKGHNRASFELRLLHNAEALLKDFPLVAIHRVSGRLVCFFKEKTDRDTVLRAAELLKIIPGVARVSSGFKCPRILDVMGNVACCALEEVPHFETFKVQARRNHTDFPTNSMELNQRIGSVLCEHFPDKRVLMKSPDVVVGVEVVQNAVYVYAHSERGIGGLPVGSSGRVVCLLSSGIDSPVALWRMARRGAICIGLHFSGRPQTSDSSEYLVDDIAHVLERSGCIARVYVVPFGNYQKEIALSVPPAYRVIMYRRLMMKVAQRVALREGAGALVTGESLGQVASQTLENLQCTNDATTLPVFRPLIGCDKQEIIADAEKLTTFEISSQDASDCCTLFIPRNPETHGSLDQVHESEAVLPLERWIDEIMSALEVHDYNCPAYKKPKK